jgi:hypothetical protein
MATINLGRIKPVWKNTWTATTAYVVDDIVRSGVTSYICINAHTSGASFAVGSDWNIMSQGSNVGTGTAGQVLKTNSGGTGTEWGEAGLSGIVSTADATAITIGSDEGVVIKGQSTYRTAPVSGGGILDIRDDGGEGGVGAVGNHGGGIVFGVDDGPVDGYFAGIKAGLGDGGGLTAGHLKFYTRGATTDTYLTERFRIEYDGRGVSPFTARVWINFNGNGTIAIRDSHNVSSISDIATGRYSITYTTAITGNCAVSALSHNASTNSCFTSCENGSSSRNSSLSLRVWKAQNTGVYSDADMVTATTFGKI